MWIRFDGQIGEEFLLLNHGSSDYVVESQHYDFTYNFFLYLTIGCVIFDLNYYLKIFIKMADLRLKVE